MPGRVEILSFESQVLQNNPLGDPAMRRVAVYLPPAYESSRRYPVVYLLAGFAGRGTMMLNESPWEENIAERLDRLISSDQVLPLIAVLPDCFTRYGGSQYINSTATGRYEDYLVGELVPWVDQTLATRAERDYRAIAGRSSGGFGALTLSMHHPDVFGLTACHSADMYFELCYGPDLTAVLRSIERFGGVKQFLESFQTIRPKGGDFFPILNALAMASCYSPNPDSPWSFDLPMDLETGEPRPDVWARWKAWDPIERVGEFADALNSLRLLYLDCGTLDEHMLQFGARTFSARLKRAGVPHTYDEFHDGHRDTQYRYDASLTAMTNVWRSM